jgi:phospholipase C
VLRFLEQRFGVVESNISPWRRAVFGDLTSAFNFATPNESVPSLPSQNQATAEIQYLQQSSAGAVPVPAADVQSLPVQAAGTRPSRGLPYALEVRARARRGSGTVHLSFINRGSAAALFHVYDRLHLDQLPRRYTVEPGKVLGDAWTVEAADQNAYDLWVLGPNGFHRLFRGVVGTAGDTSALDVQLAFDAAASSLTATFANAGLRAATLVATANAYRDDAPLTLAVPPGGTLAQQWDLSGSGGWYDFTVRAARGFTRRFAGRLETGADGISDPAMGDAQTPTPFAFRERAKVAPNAWVASAPAALAGFSGYLPVNLQGDGSSQLSVDGGPFTTSAPNVCAGQTLQLRHKSASDAGAVTETIVMVGGFAASFKSVTVPG